MEHFNGNLLRDLRKSSGLNQKEMALIVGVSVRTVRNIEKNDEKTMRSISLKVLNRWWQACNSKSQNKPCSDRFVLSVVDFLELRN